MTISISFLNCNRNSSRRQSHIALINPCSLLIGAALVVYVMVGVISTAQAQINHQCIIEPSRREKLQRAMQGFFKDLHILKESYYMDDLSFQDSDGKAIKLAEFQGKTLLVNLWVLWCIPCRNEILELSALKKKLHRNFDILAINIDRNTDKKIENFLEEANAANLALYRSKATEIFQAVKSRGVGFGLPITLVVDSKGCLLASFSGFAPWSDKNAITFIEAAMKTN